MLTQKSLRAFLNARQKRINEFVFFLDGITVVLMRRVGSKNVFNTFRTALDDPFLLIRAAKLVNFYKCCIRNDDFFLMGRKIPLNCS